MAVERERAGARGHLHGMILGSSSWQRTASCGLRCCASTAASKPSSRSPILRRHHRRGAEERHLLPQRRRGVIGDGDRIADQPQPTRQLHLRQNVSRRHRQWTRHRQIDRQAAALPARGRGSAPRRRHSPASHSARPCRRRSLPPSTATVAITPRCSRMERGSARRIPSSRSIEAA